MDASARQKAEMAQKIAQELLKSSSHRLASTLQSMPALNTEQSNLVRAAQQKAAEIAVQVPLPFPSLPFPSRARAGPGRDGPGREGPGREESTVFIKGLRTMERWIWRDGLGWMDGSRRVR